MTDSVGIPCADGDQDDWFISKDGKQYPSDELVEAAEQQDIADAVLAERGDEDEAFFDYVAKALAEAEADAKRAALQRRRHAKAACLDCPVRSQCLQMAVDKEEIHGTWGGYYEEELRTIRLEIARRKRARLAVSTD